MKKIQNKQLPNGWKEKSLKELAEYVNGRGFKKGEWGEKGLPIIRIQNLTGRSKEFNYFNGDIEEKNVVYPGDLLMSWSATLDVYVWEKEKAALNQHIFKVVPKIDKLFLYYLLKTKISEMYSKTHGTGMVHITKGHFENISVNIPESKEEQNLIVQEIEKQFTRLDASVKALNSVKEKLEVYRKAILKKAFGEIKKLDKLGNVIKTSSGGTPLRANASYYVGNNPWLKSGELMDKTSIEDSEEHISDEAIENSSAKLFPKNTVLMAMYGATTGKIGILTRECSTNQAVCAMLPNENYSPMFLFYYLMLKRKHIIGQGKGGAQPNISQDVIKKILFPICSKEEQTLIVQLIESKFSVIDKIEQVVETSLDKAEKLRKSILKSVFEGKLVKIEEEARK